MNLCIFPIELNIKNVDKYTSIARLVDRDDFIQDVGYIRWILGIKKIYDRQKILSLISSPNLDYNALTLYIKSKFDYNPKTRAVFVGRLEKEMLDEKSVQQLHILFLLHLLNKYNLGFFYLNVIAHALFLGYVEEDIERFYPNRGYWFMMDTSDFLASLGRMEGAKSGSPKAVIIVDRDTKLGDLKSFLPTLRRSLGGILRIHTAAYVEIGNGIGKIKKELVRPILQISQLII